MDSAAALKALTRETKALILVSEFEARRMPVFQLRAVLQALVTDDEDRKTILDMVDRDLRATGYPAEQIAAFLSDLIATGAPLKPLEMGQSVQATRRLRSPFARGFDDTGPIPAPPAAVPAPIAPPPTPAEPAKPSLTRVNLRPSNAPGSSAQTPAVPVKSTPTPPTGTPRRNTFAFVTPKPADSAAPAGDAPVGTMAWRLQQAFGDKNAAPVPANASAGNARPLILVADDDKRIRMVFRLRLEEAGMTVFECDNGLEAWERLQKGDVSAAILDMKMPGLHGLEVLSHMTDKGMQTPVVVCSAYDQLQDEFVVKTYPHIRYLTKPVAPEQLVAAIRELLAKR
ncbi:MAG TPA: response regulator [Planctomycetota bacterium]|nr:response regulator [Planctomycetota bacterium]